MVEVKKLPGYECYMVANVDSELDLPAIENEIDALNRLMFKLKKQRIDYGLLLYEAEKKRHDNTRNNSK